MSLSAIAGEVPPPGLPPPATEKLSLVAFSKINVVDSRAMGTILFAQALGVQADYQLNNDNRISLVLDVAPAYRYAIMTDDSPGTGKFDDEAFVDEFYWHHQLTQRASIEIGKRRFVTAHAANLLPVSPGNMLTLEQNFFPRWGVLLDAASSNKLFNFQFYIGESSDGQSDLGLDANGVFVATKAQYDFSKQIALYASSTLDQLPEQNFTTASLGAVVKSEDGRRQAYANVSRLEGDPYRFSQDATLALEVGMECRLNSKNKAGVVLTCVRDEGNQLVAVVKHDFSPTFSVLVYGGWRDYASQFNSIGVKDGPIVGVAVDALKFFKR